MTPERLKRILDHHTDPTIVELATALQEAWMMIDDLEDVSDALKHVAAAELEDALKKHERLYSRIRELKAERSLYKIALTTIASIDEPAEVLKQRARLALGPQTPQECVSKSERKRIDALEGK